MLVVEELVGLFESPPIHAHGMLSMVAPSGHLFRIPLVLKLPGGHPVHAEPVGPGHQSISDLGHHLLPLPAQGTLCGSNQHNRPGDSPHQHSARRHKRLLRPAAETHFLIDDALWCPQGTHLQVES